MTYLFGDSTPSDLTIDYIEFLREALDLSVQILAAHERMLQGAARAVEVRREGEAEATRLEALGSAQARAIEAFDIGKDEGPTAQCAQSLLRGAAETVRSAIERVRAASASDVGKIEDEARRDRERCVEALGAFLKRHDLPQMTTELRLQQLGGNGYAARLYVRALESLQAVLDLEIPAAHLFSSVARVDKLVERLEVHAPESGGWLRKEVKLRPQRLDKEFIYSMVASPSETMVQLRSAADGSGVGFDLTIRNDGTRVSLRRVGEATELPPFDLDETDSSKVRDFRDKLVEETADLRRARKGLVEAMVGDTSLAEQRDPKIIVERLVAAMAPVVREITKRSLAPTELVLKRQTGDGRREEIFVARRDLQVKLRPLGPAARAVFAPLELGDPPPEEVMPKVIVPDAKAMAAEKAAADKAALEKKQKTAAEKSIFAEALAVDKPTAQRAMVPPTAPKPKEESVRLDDSLERLIVSEDTHKP
ncbi:MAG: hypothetical protein ACXVCV_01425 [Polyangia bacterium]